MLSLNLRSILSLATVFSAAPMLAALANFEPLVLEQGFESAQVTGTTGGAISLSTIANRDEEGNACVGYGDPENPDHILVLEDNFEQLTLEVNSRGGNTTLIVQGPDQTVRCAFGTSSDPDAILSDSQWKDGQYKVWVGSFEPGQYWNYRLSIQQDGISD
ncbi:MAG: hypothetical protein ACOC0N_01430 [Chroococcales cyanobacterium]